MPNDAERRKRLRARGLRATWPRLTVLRILWEADRPLSHSQVVARHAPWDRVTVYRNLLALVRARLVHVVSGSGMARYELEARPAPSSGERSGV